MESQEANQQNEYHTEDIKRVLEDLLHRMSITAAEIETTDLLGGVCFHVKTPEGSVLIGENGQHLGALYTILRRMVEHRYGAGISFTLDVNDYQRHRVEEIKERARMSAQRVRYFKKEVVMQPMSSYERRVVHLALIDDPDVKTESVGEGEHRKVVIKPV